MQVFEMVIVCLLRDSGPGLLPPGAPRVSVGMDPFEIHTKK